MSTDAFRVGAGGEVSAQVTHCGALDMQVCVPAGWTDKQVVVFAELKYPCGTTGGWVIRRAGHEALAGYPDRIPCRHHDGFVHIMLDA